MSLLEFLDITTLAQFSPKTHACRAPKATGLSISEVLKRGLHAYLHAENQADVRPYEIYRRLDLGAGGWSRAPAAEAKRAAKEAMQQKIGR
jgi:hypothetical protein